PHYAEAQYNLGNVLQQQGRLGGAEACFRQAIRLKPDYADAHNNLGVALRDQQQLSEAEVCFREAVRLQPHYAAAHNNLGAALREQGRVREAEACLQHAVRLKPDYADAHYNLGMARLLLGNYEQGWPEYEWRWQCQGHGGQCFPQSLWDGAPLTGRTTLLHPEQGLGETLQFIR